MGYIVYNTHWSQVHTHISLFTNGNKGGLVSITLFNTGASNETLAEELPFMAIDYDPIKKGDDMVISLGGESIAFSHTIDASVELWETHDDKGVVTSMEIVDQNNNKVTLTFSQ